VELLSGRVETVYGFITRVSLKSDKHKWCFAVTNHRNRALMQTVPRWIYRKKQEDAKWEEKHDKITSYYIIIDCKWT